MINGVNANSAAVQKYEPAKKQDSTMTADKGQTKGNDSAAVLEIGKSSETPAATYSKPVINSKKFSSEEIDKLWAEANRATENLRKLVESLLKEQGKTFQGVLEGTETLVIDDKTRAEAAQAISDEGEYGAEAVSDRIVAFAKSVSNNNPEMYDKLMGAIKEGFAQAEKAFGGKLPEVCYKTRDAIDKKMEEWKNGQQTTVEK